MLLNCNDLDSKSVYGVMIQTIIPRPIAWVLSDNGDDSYNLAPFSYFNGITSRPPILAISAGHKKSGDKKDTWENIDRRREFVVHLPSAEHLSAVTDSGAELPFGESEVNKLELNLKNIEGEKLPRLEGPKVAFYCHKYAIYEVGENKQGLILGQIKKIWLDDKVVTTHEGKIIVDANKLNPLARLGGDDYSLVGETLIQKRP